ncbi:hypothetical protein D3C85_1317570 [compost metagenome]
MGGVGLVDAHAGGVRVHQQVLLQQRRVIGSKRLQSFALAFEGVPVLRATERLLELCGGAHAGSTTQQG